jgi:glycerol-3-phosphate dehydrogenase
MNKFSVLERESILQRLKSETFDLVVIGGGITGAGIALDAASRGLKTALLEKNDFAFGTSSRSTKLIHGGLRYLKQFEFGLVKEVGSERAVVHKLAPHLVVPEKMLLPLYEKKGLGYWLTSVGLRIYDFLAGVKPEDQRRMLTRPQTLRHEPLLKKDGVKGGALYAEYRTDDARLTLEILKIAIQQDATAINYCKVLDFIYNSETIEGVQATCQHSGESFIVHAKAVVSAAGPWVDELRETNQSKTGKRLHLTKGVHVVVPHDKFPIHQAIYFDVEEDGRMIFAIPRRRTTYIGTTDTNYVGDLDRVVASREDALYLINGVNSTFANIDLKLSDLESSWAGLRPLIHEDGKSASELSRKDEIFESPSGLISIAGGKLTGYRKMAERVVDLVIKKSFPEKTLKDCHTEKLKLNGGDFQSYKAVIAYIQKIQKELMPYNLQFAARYLVENYGTQTNEILKHFKTHVQEPAELSLLKSELWFTIEYEMVVTLQDFFVRRTGLLYFEIGKLLRWKTEIAKEFKIKMNWDEQRLMSEQKQLDQLISEVTEFK